MEPAHLLMGVLRDGEGMGAHLLHQLAEHAALRAATGQALDVMPAASPGGEVSRPRRQRQCCRRRSRWTSSTAAAAWRPSTWSASS